MSLASDNTFMDGFSCQMAALTPNTTTGGYDVYIDFLPEQHNLLPGSYICQLEVNNQDGIFWDTKMMTSSL